MFLFSKNKKKSRTLNVSNRLFIGEFRLNLLEDVKQLIKASKLFNVLNNITTNNSIITKIYSFCFLKQVKIVIYNLKKKQEKNLFPVILRGNFTNLKIELKIHPMNTESYNACICQIFYISPKTIINHFINITFQFKFTGRFNAIH